MACQSRRAEAVYTSAAAGGFLGGKKGELMEKTCLQPQCVVSKHASQKSGFCSTEGDLTRLRYGETDRKATSTSRIQVESSKLSQSAVWKGEPLTHVSGIHLQACRSQTEVRKTSSVEQFVTRLSIIYIEIANMARMLIWSPARARTHRAPKRLCGYTDAVGNQMLTATANQ